MAYGLSLQLSHYSPSTSCSILIQSAGRRQPRNLGPSIHVEDVHVAKGTWLKRGSKLQPGSALDAEVIWEKNQQLENSVSIPACITLLFKSTIIFFIVKRGKPQFRENMKYQTLYSAPRICWHTKRRLYKNFSPLMQ